VIHPKNTKNKVPNIQESKVPKIQHTSNVWSLVFNELTKFFVSSISGASTVFIFGFWGFLELPIF
jgi:hypothetical protein